MEEHQRISADRVTRKRGKSTTMAVVSSPVEKVDNNVSKAEMERKNLHDHHLNAVKLTLEAAEKKWNDKTVSQTERFMIRAQEILLIKQERTTPVAFVPSGLSMDEDQKTFSRIEEEVRKYTPLCARISSFKCPNVKIAFQTICNELNSPSSTTPRALRDEIHTNSDSIKMVAILVEKAEYFKKNVFPQLLQLLSSVDLPYLFIVGVSHCIGNFDRFIPSNCNTAFVYSSFETVSTTQRLNQVLYNILDPDLGPFTLDGEVVKFLCRHYQSQHASIQRLFQAYRICLLEHYRKPESVLCRVPYPESSAVEDDTLAKVSQLSGIPNGKKMTKTINECWVHIAHWNFVIRIICFIKSSLRAVAPEDLFKDLYISCSTGLFFETAEEEIESPYKRFLTDIRNLPKSGLKKVICKLSWDLGLEESKHDPYQGLIHSMGEAYFLHTKVREIIDTVEKLNDDLERLDEQEIQLAENPNPPVETKFKIKKGIGRNDLKQQLMERIKIKSCSQPVNALRDAFISFIENLVKTYLKPFPSLLKGVYHKAYIFDDVLTLKSLFSPDPFSYVTNSLMLPSEILNCKCCEDVSTDSNIPSLPDTSIVFKLLREQTNKKVDLNILYQAFLSILETDEVSARGRKSIRQKKLDPNVCLLRFRQSVAELQFSGVLKRSRTKPDEITKLTWQ
ncbi:origin recognition complex subunit 3 [Folsomia candida]|uniref:origin recognition complex subunit 3 n=1 Tax=Folsomia candida TaxID=158441 RepID=UPI000B8FBEA2|nr:origin recognition complex subunit 3 [Folsomia candida]